MTLQTTIQTSPCKCINRKCHSIGSLTNKFRVLNPYKQILIQRLVPLSAIKQPSGVSKAYYWQQNICYAYLAQIQENCCSILKVAPKCTLSQCTLCMYPYTAHKGLRYNDVSVIVTIPKYFLHSPLPFFYKLHIMPQQKHFTTIH